MNSKGNFYGRTERPLRYTPDGRDFVITNGAEFFNRPLYGRNTAFRADGGDKPEFSLYLPGRGGNLRFGLKTSAGVKWLNDAQQVVARYRPGSMRYEIRDPLLGDGVLQLAVLTLTEKPGIIAQVEAQSVTAPVELVWAFGGANGMRGRRGGDIGCEREPVSDFFQLRADQCASNVFSIAQNTFTLRNPTATIIGVASTGAELAVGDANLWAQPEKLLADAHPGFSLAPGFSPVSGAGVTSAVSTASPAASPKTVETVTGHATDHTGLKPGVNETGTGASHPSQSPPKYPVVVGRIALSSDQPVYLALQQSGDGSAAARVADLPGLCSAAEAHRRSVAERVLVETPDPLINAAAAALNVAADAIWDEKLQSFMHGAVAWRTRLLGWRGPYAGDTLGWHERTAAHFAGYARQQNTNPIPEKIPPADAIANLARNEAGLHSNGDMMKSHYDMNLVGVDAFFRHLKWTGDLDYARRMWPVIERHLAWERRLFRREFGADKLPLYEAYAAIWASDDLHYHGGGATHASAYNYWHNQMAARVAKLLGQDATLYEREAELISQAMRKNLWLGDRGWFGEFKDYFGLQLVHPNAALWTFYHTLDSKVPSPFEAWQMTRFVDTQIPRIPISISGVASGILPDVEPGVSPGGTASDENARIKGSDAIPGGKMPAATQSLFTLSTTSWMPYMWSINNVVLAEVQHTALGYWQAGRADAAFSVFKGSLTDTMLLGLCPGNIGTLSYHDMARGEAQRDFADGCGATSRALVEGLFGVLPDALAGELKLRPGFPAQWNHASIRHPGLNFAFKRAGSTETYSVEQKFSKLLALRLEIPALRESVASVMVNGQSAKWEAVPDSVGGPRIEITSAAVAKQEVVIVWRGRAPGSITAPTVVTRGDKIEAKISGHELVAVKDPQGALSELVVGEYGFAARATGTPGHRTIFAQVRQGALNWWQPVAFEIRAEAVLGAPGLVDWSRKLPATTKFEPVNLAAAFNDKVTQIFRNEYLAPRSPFVSLAVPKQGIGSWCDFNAQCDVDDSGLRAAAARGDGQIVLPNGVPLQTPGAADAKNIVFTSQWDNYPNEASVRLTGKSSHAYLLMAGSSNPMQCRFDNGEVIVTYTDGTSARLALHSPVSWWLIDQDFFLDDYAFRRDEPLPPRVDLKTGKIRVLDMATFKGKGGKVAGGAATVLDLPLDATKELKSLTVRALANEVVIGLMSVTLAR